MKIQTAIISCLSSFAIGIGVGILIGVTAAKKHYENEEKERVPQGVIDEICRHWEEKEPKVIEDFKIESVDVCQGPDGTIEQQPVIKVGNSEKKEPERKHTRVDYTRYRYAPEHEEIDETDPMYEKRKPHFVEQDVVLNDNEIDCVPLTYYKGDRVLVCEDGIGPDVIDEVDARDMLGDCLREIEDSDVGEVYVLNEINNRYYEVSIVDGWFESPEEYEEVPKVEKIRKRRRLDG